MNTLFLHFGRVMLFLAEFESAITPKYAGHYAQRKLDIEYWRGEVHRKQVRGSCA